MIIVQVYKKVKRLFRSPFWVDLGYVAQILPSIVNNRYSETILLTKEEDEFQTFKNETEAKYFISYMKKLNKDFVFEIRNHTSLGADPE